MRILNGSIFSTVLIHDTLPRLFGNRWLPRATCAHGAQVNDGPIDIDGGFKNCLDSFVADVSLCRCLNGFWAWLPYHIRPQLRFSGGLPPPPPAEKATYLDFIRSRHTLHNALALSSYGPTSNAQHDQRYKSDADEQHYERDGVVFEPMPITGKHGFSSLFQMDERVVQGLKQGPEIERRASLVFLHLLEAEAECGTQPVLA